MAKKKSSKKTRQTANRIAVSKSTPKQSAKMKTEGSDALIATGDQQTVSGNHETVTGDHATVSGEHETVTGDHATVAGEHETVTGDHATVSGEHETVTGDHATVSGEHETVTGDHATVTGDHATVSGDHETVTGDHATVSGDHATVSGDHETIIGDHATVSGDHETISGDHATVSRENEGVSGDHKFATVAPAASPAAAGAVAGGHEPVSSQPTSWSAGGSPALSTPTAAENNTDQTYNAGKSSGSDGWKPVDDAPVSKPVVATPNDGWKPVDAEPTASWKRPVDYFGVSASSTYHGMRALTGESSAETAPDEGAVGTGSGDKFSRFKSKIAAARADATAEPKSTAIDSGSWTQQLFAKNRQEPQSEPLAKVDVDPAAQTLRAEPVQPATEPALPPEAKEQVTPQSEFPAQPAQGSADPLFGGAVEIDKLPAQSPGKDEPDLRPITPKIAKYIANLKDSIVAQRGESIIESPAPKKDFNWKEAEALLKSMTAAPSEPAVSEPAISEPSISEPVVPAPKSATEPIGNKPPLFPLADEHQQRPKFQRTVDASKISEKSEALKAAEAKKMQPEPLPDKPKEKEKEKVREEDDPAKKKKSVQDLRESIISQGEGSADDWHPVERVKKSSPRDLGPAIEALQKMPADFGLEPKPKFDAPKIHHSLEELAAMDPSLQVAPSTNQHSIRRLKSTASSGIRLGFILTVTICCMVVGFVTQLTTPKPFIEPGERARLAAHLMTPNLVFQNFYQGMKIYEEQLPKPKPTANKGAPARTLTTAVLSPIAGGIYALSRVWFAATDKAGPLSCVIVALEYLSFILFALICYVKVRRQTSYSLLEKCFMIVPLIVGATIISYPIEQLLDVVDKLGDKLMPDTIAFFTVLTCIICILDAAWRSFFVRKTIIDPRD